MATDPLPTDATPLDPIPARKPTPFHGFPCPSCGAAMAYDPARSALACAACGHARALPSPTPDERAQALREQDYLEALRRLAAREPSLDLRVVDCPSCGAQLQLEGHVVGSRCAFCSSPLLLDQARTERVLKPQALLPFALDPGAAQKVFAQWVGSRWFAPNALKQTVSRADGIRGVYVPWWTYDAQTATTYRGERGESRTEEDNQGRIRRTVDWSFVSGAVAVPFDDILVVGSPSVPEHLARVLDGWDLRRLRPPAPELLAGFTVEVYRHGLEQGFTQARERMEPAITAAIRRDIGGSDQRILERQTVVDDIRFKHVLLPVWIGSYRFGGKPYQVVVNGQSGEVEGDRPYSVVKIALAVIAALLVLLVLVQFNAN